MRITDALAARPELFEDLLVDDEVNRWWLQLWATESYEVRLLTWEREQSSDWHDHGGSSGAWTVTAGTLYETYRAEDHVSVRDRHYVAGDHGSFGPEHVHDVIYEAGKPAVEHPRLLPAAQRSHRLRPDSIRLRGARVRARREPRRAALSLEAHDQGLIPHACATRSNDLKRAARECNRVDTMISSAAVRSSNATSPSLTVD